jgi:rubredoxin
MHDQQSPSLTPHQIVVVRTCPECLGKMFIRRIDPDKPGYEKRTFECAMCDYVETSLVKCR